MAGAGGAPFVPHPPARRGVGGGGGDTRAGGRYGVARLRSNPEDLLAADDLVPGLGDALARTLTQP